MDDMSGIYDKLSLKQIYSLCLGSIDMYCSVGDVINILSKASKHHKITPFIWSILSLGFHVYREVNGGWYSFRYHSNNIYKLLNLFPEITQKDYDSMIKPGLMTLLRREKTQKTKFDNTVKIVEYNYDVLDINHMPDDYLHYKRMYGNIIALRLYDHSYGEDTDSCDTEDMEKALENAEIELREELKEDNDEDNNNEDNNNEDNNNEDNGDAQILNLNKYNIIKTKKM
jgi:hypothetical protein